MTEQEEDREVQSGKAETESGKLRWWRPDLVYRAIKREYGQPASKTVPVTLFVCLLGPMMNSMMVHAERTAEQVQHYQNKEKEKVKRREKWRLEAKEEYQNE